MLSRRTILTTGAALLAGLGPAPAASDAALAQRFAALEAESGGRLGIHARDTRTGAGFGHRADERFPMCSTFKLLAAGAVLARVDAGRDSLGRRIAYTAADLVDYSPATQAHLREGSMALADLCEAAVTLSDNTAGNLILSTLGGPAGLTAHLRTLGDPVTRLDRTEPTLNEAAPGDPRDTTSPAAMVADLERLTLGTALTAASRDTLVGWLRGNRTGGARLRARLPEGWRVGDKTGSGERGTTNDVGLLWPPDGAPILVAAYLTDTTAPVERRNAILAEAGRAIAEAFGPNPENPRPPR
ncbi:class A beta-lactamase [Methylobacterium sp. J-068]|uniref:class A beta-lactamase n=1 Tax=Methylobacterium sp. J-068 TaxID=2836649 RepID=UPI001FB86FB4|nr:class A beta-lactamase [Methylobacterium sp. J-068]MCJ2033227.1 class A beta-lactamase [Methylobacterium sp. J-068]